MIVLNHIQVIHLVELCVLAGRAWREADDVIKKALSKTKQRARKAEELADGDEQDPCAEKVTREDHSAKLVGHFYISQLSRISSWS